MLIIIRNATFSTFCGNHTIFKVKGSEEMIFSAKIPPSTLHNFQKSQAFTHPNLLKTIALQAKWTDLFLTDSDLAFFEYAPWTLRSLIMKKKREKTYFKETELVLLLKGIVSVLAFLQKNELCHGNINPQVIFYDNQRDCFKVLDQELISGYLSVYTLAVQGKFFSCYSSPEVLIALQEKNILLVKNGFKNDIFSLGMCILEAATLMVNEEIYDRKKLKIVVKEVEERLKMVEEMYSFEFYKVLESLLIFEPSKRSDAVEMEKYLKGNKTIEIKTKKLNERELPKIIEEINICYSSRKFESVKKEETSFGNKTENRKSHDFKSKSAEPLEKDHPFHNNIYISNTKENSNTILKYPMTKNFETNYFSQQKPNCFRGNLSPPKTIFLKSQFRSTDNEPKVTYRIRTTPINYEKETDRSVFSERTEKRKKMEGEFESLEQSLNRLDKKIDKILINSQQITRNSFHSSVS